MIIADPASGLSLRLDGLTPEMPLLDGIDRILRQKLLTIEACVPAAIAASSEDSAAIHKLRVATRRLAASLQALGEAIPEAPRRSLDKALTRIRAACGMARELDVERHFLEQKLSETDATELAVVDLLYERVTNRRSRLQPKMARQLKQLQPKLEKSGVWLLTELHALRSGRLRDQGTFGAAACRILMRELDRLPEEDQAKKSKRELHTLRLTGKRLRYACEVFQPILGPEFEQELYPELERMQDVLGTMRDSELAVDRYDRLRRRWRKNRHRSSWDRKPQGLFSWKDLRSGLKFITQAHRQLSRDARQEFQDLWPRVNGAGFRTPFQDLLHRLTPSAESGTIAAESGARENRPAGRSTT